jgi:hypothetical protein
VSETVVRVLAHARCADRAHSNKSHQCSDSALFGRTTALLFVAVPPPLSEYLLAQRSWYDSTPTRILRIPLNFNPKLLRPNTVRSELNVNRYVVQV